MPKHILFPMVRFLLNGRLCKLTLFATRNDRQRKRALHSPAKRCRVVTAWPGCCQAVVRARENPLVVVGRAKLALGALIKQKF